jgi:hypothetical protein
MPVRRLRGVGTPVTGGAAGSGSTTPPPPVDDAIALALETLDLLQQRAHEVAEGFRWNRVSEANRGLTEIVQSTGTLLRLALAASKATGANLAQLCEIGDMHVDEVTCTALDHLIAKQFAADWNGVADILDDDFIPALALWRFVFEALRSNDDDDNGGRAA